MGNILLANNGNALMLIPRSGSHSLFASWLKEYATNNYNKYVKQNLIHPASYLPNHIEYSDNFPKLAVIVRNPIERFRSIVAHQPLISIERQLQDPSYGFVTQYKFEKAFKFETQLQQAAEWIEVKELLHLDKTDERIKPNLTSEQEEIVRKIYADDIILWESL